MTGHPTAVTVKLDDGTGTFPHDISSKVLMVGGLELKRGRGDEDDATSAGELSLTLNNSDGRFSLGSTIIASPSPITVDNRIRVTHTVNGSTFDRTTEYVKSWPVAWPAVVDTFSTVTITASDAQARAERWTLGLLLDEEAGLDSPTIKYNLAEAVGSTTATDSSGNQNSLLTPLGSIVFGNSLVFPKATVTGCTVNSTTGAGLRSAESVPEMAWLGAAFSLTIGSAGTHYIANCFSTNGLAIGVDVGGQARAVGYGQTVVAGPAVDDAAPHVIFATATPGVGSQIDLYVDGVLVGSSGAATITLGAPCPFEVNDPSGVGSVMTVARVVGGTDPISGARVLSQMDAYLTGFDGESGVDRITRLANYADIPLGTIDASLTNVPYVDPSGASAWPAIQDVVDAEGGLAYVDGAGNLRFKNRNAAPAKTAPDVTFTRDLVIPDAQPTGDDQGLINYLTTTSQATGIEQVVRNELSEKGNGTATCPGHGRYAEDRSYLVLTDAEALDRGNWIVGNHAEPSIRYPALNLNLYKMTPTQQAQAMSIEPGTWLRITGFPPQTPGGTTVDVMVEGITEQLGENAWTLSLNVVARSLYTAGIYDDPTFGLFDNARFYF